MFLIFCSLKEPVLFLLSYSFIIYFINCIFCQHVSPGKELKREKENAHPPKDSLHCQLKPNLQRSTAGFKVI